MSRPATQGKAACDSPAALCVRLRLRLSQIHVWAQPGLIAARTHQRPLRLLTVAGRDTIRLRPGNQDWPRQTPDRQLRPPQPHRAGLITHGSVAHPRADNVPGGSPTGPGPDWLGRGRLLVPLFTLPGSPGERTAKPGESFNGKPRDEQPRPRDHLRSPGSKGSRPGGWRQTHNQPPPPQPRSGTTHPHLNPPHPHP